MDCSALFTTRIASGTTLEILNLHSVNEFFLLVMRGRLYLLVSNSRCFLLNLIHCHYLLLVLSSIMLILCKTIPKTSSHIHIIPNTERDCYVLVHIILESHILHCQMESLGDV